MFQLLFPVLYLGKESALAKQKIELSESRAAVLLSQTQPHSLYNVMMKRRGSVAIAAEAVDCDYYRFLDTDTPVPANLWCSTNGRAFTAGFSDE